MLKQIAKGRRRLCPLSPMIRLRHSTRTLSLLASGVISTPSAKLRVNSGRNLRSLTFVRDDIPCRQPYRVSVPVRGKTTTKRAGWFTALFLFIVTPCAWSGQAEDALNEGLKLHEAGKPKEAIQEYDRAIKVNPKLTAC